MGRLAGTRWIAGLAGVLLLVPLLAACGDEETGGYTGRIEIDGSSTVFPISQAVAEEFFLENRGSRITVGASGTGGGFDKLCRGEIDISNASRHINAEEAAQCEENGIEITEIQVAADGLSVIVNQDNDWVDCLTVDQLHEIWRPGSPIQKWSDIDPSWPDQDLHLYGPGTDSGTFDYFTETINGEVGASRADYSASEDDNTLIQGVEGDRYAMAYLGYAYYSENAERLKVLAIDNGDGCVAPSPETVQNETYEPLSRPVFIYVNNEQMRVDEAPELDEPGPASTLAGFVTFYLTEGVEIIPFVGYIPFDEATYNEELRKVEAIMAGT